MNSGEKCWDTLIVSRVLPIQTAAVNTFMQISLDTRETIEKQTTFFLVGEQAGWIMTYSHSGKSEWTNSMSINMDNVEGRRKLKISYMQCIYVKFQNIQNTGVYCFWIHSTWKYKGTWKTTNLLQGIWYLCRGGGREQDLAFSYLVRLYLFQKLSEASIAKCYHWLNLDSGDIDACYIFLCTFQCLKYFKIKI